MYHKNLTIFLVPILTWAVTRSVNFTSFQLLFGSIWFQLLIVEMYDDCVSFLRKLSFVWHGLKIVSLRACVHMTRSLVSEPHGFRTVFRILGYPGRQWTSSSCWLHAIQFSPRYLRSCWAKVPSFSFAFQALCLQRWFAFMDDHIR